MNQVNQNEVSTGQNTKMRFAYFKERWNQI